VQEEEDSQYLTNMLRCMREGKIEHDVIEGPERCIQPVTKWAVRMDIMFFILDFATDLKQIHDLYLGKQHFLGGVTTCLFCASTAAISKDLRKLRHESKETVRMGIFTEEYLHIMNFEKGFESAISLLLSAYISRFAVTGIDSFLSTAVNILVSAYSLGVYLHRRVILITRCKV